MSGQEFQTLDSGVVDEGVMEVAGKMKMKSMCYLKSGPQGVWICQ